MKAHLPGFFPGSGAMLVAGGVLVSTCSNQQLKDYLYGEILQEHLRLKYGWMKSTFDNIHWTSHEAALQRFSILQRITVYKLIHGWLATRKNRTRVGKAHSPLCTLCM